MYVASGSQADRPDRNKVTLLKLSDLHRTQQNAGIVTTVCAVHLFI